MGEKGGGRGKAMAPDRLLNRCKVCRTPIRGVLGLFSRLKGITVYRKNPQLCTRCERMDFPPGLRAVSVLFVDIRGYTPLAERLGPSALTKLLNRYYAATCEVIFRHDAVIEFAGDAVMAIFNAPIPRQDHERAALAAALEIQKAVRELHLPELQVGVGVNAGEGTVGLMVKGDVKDFTVVGDVVNVAARLQAKAQAGEIIACDTVVEKGRDLIPGSYGVEKASLELKGKEGLCPAYILTPRATGG
jgi:adenylate cyclase